jgi:hypothetical protein
MFHLQSPFHVTASLQRSFREFAAATVASLADAIVDWRKRLLILQRALNRVPVVGVARGETPNRRLKSRQKWLDRSSRLRPSLLDAEKRIADEIVRAVEALGRSNVNGALPVLSRNNRVSRTERGSLSGRALPLAADPSDASPSARSRGRCGHRWYFTPCEIQPACRRTRR